jgi:hypothetical protein
MYNYKFLMSELQVEQNFFKIFEAVQNRGPLNSQKKPPKQNEKKIASPEVSVLPNAKRANEWRQRNGTEDYAIE